jgi:hypothetical protein
MEDVRLDMPDKPDQFPKQIRVVIGSRLEPVKYNAGQVRIIRSFFRIGKMDVMTKTGKFGRQITKLPLCPAS